MPDGSGIRGVFGRPFIVLDEHLDLGALPELHEEICLGLSQVPVDYTGGSHRSMGIVPASRASEVLTDYGEVIAGLDDAGFEVFRSLADDPGSLDPRDRESLEFGEERAHPLSRRQMLWLKLRHGVYFPWKVYFEMIPNRLWADKSSAAGKAFTRLARTFFPKTVAFVQSLPFESIGRCNVMGLEAHDHGTVHRDGEPDERAEKDEPDHFITFCPAGPAARKRLFLWDEGRRDKTYPPASARAYWFNDHDYHGVDAAPFFRYSVRVDGVFEAEFLERLTRAARGGAG
jgi:hypothetical protein